jgi:hypothetical protein
MYHVLRGTSGLSFDARLRLRGYSEARAETASRKGCYVLLAWM